MHGADEGKEGTKMKGRQGGTRFDCPKSKRKSRKLKVRDAFFSELVRFWEERRAPLCSVQRGRHSGAFTTEKQAFLSKTSTQAPHKQLNGLIKAQ